MTAATAFMKKNDFHIDFKDIIVSDREPLIHYHDVAEIAFFVRADIRVFVGERSYTVRDGDIMLLDKFETHRIEYTSGTAYTRYVINFSDSFVGRVLSSTGQEQLMPNLLSDKQSRVRTTNQEQREQLKQLLCSLWSIFQSIPQTEEQTALLRLQTASLLLLFHTLSDKPHDERPTQKEELVQRIIGYIDEKYRHEVSLQSVAHDMHLSKFYVGHTFKEITRMTMTEYLHFKRVAEAKRQLKHSTNSVLEIGLDCGFNNAKHFHRVFKRLTGYTPHQYRKLT